MAKQNSLGDVGLGLEVTSQSDKWKITQDISTMTSHAPIHKSAFRAAFQANLLKEHCDKPQHKILKDLLLALEMMNIKEGEMDDDSRNIEEGKCLTMNYESDVSAFSKPEVIEENEEDDDDFARLFKPKITEESMEYLVEQYRHLRQRDTDCGFKSSWRIIMRQLEFMVCLSESMAPMGCSDQVLPKHVKEAYRLLNKSIIRVDQPDIQFEDEEAAAAMQEER